MVKNEAKMWRDLIILLVIVVVIYYLRQQAGDAGINPFTGAQAFFSRG